jgi:aspartyl-tRNA(Asn)/glutamyl-tRNA(Gln) amidotransferase subunit B
MSLDYELIVGLEVHVQLLTASKLFCRCSTRFGAEPNTQTCPLCTGMPGSLPVMNEHAFWLSVQTGLALNCEIAETSKWDRKNYFYPDLPKGYQISQLDKPVASRGFLAISSPKAEFAPKKIGINRAHLEEDAGKSMHDEAAGIRDSKIDLNRCGTPLLEIVSEPDMRSAAEARAFLNELKLILGYLGVSDCNMQEGSLRVDANVNLHLVQDGQKIATPIVEVKNMNSFRAVERALLYEAQRQLQHWQETGQLIGDVPKQTRGWDDINQYTIELRSKEESSDYRYFPDPDLVTVKTTAAQIEEVRRALPRLPGEIRQQFEQEYQLSEYDADVIVNQGKAVVDYFVALATGCGDAKLASNWVQQHVLRTLNEQQISIEQFPIHVDRMIELLQAIQQELLDSSRAKEVFAELLQSELSVAQTMDKLGIKQVDTGELQRLCQELLDANPQVVEHYRGGKTQAIGALIGRAKKANPNVNPDQVRQILIQLIEA